MHLTSLLLLSAPGLLATAEPVPAPDLDVTPRALPNSPSGGYAPAIVPCPANRPRVRDGSSLSVNETAWLQRRRRATVDPMIEFLTRVGIPDFDAAAYIRAAAPDGATDFAALPNVAIAASGGGYRALMNGAGFVAAADSRTAGATGKGGIGGLLQSSTYLAGLSGGGWLVGSIMINNFSSVETLRDGGLDSSIWEFDRSIFSGPRESGIRVLNTAGYWKDVVDQVDEKRDAGFEASLTDYWGRALSYQLINAPDGGPAYTFSSIAETPAFQAADIPFPILVADGRAPGERLISLNATVFEFNPFEMGTFDPTVYGFVPLKYLASNFSNGVIPRDGNCVSGFDSASFIMGTSSSLFNVFLLQNITAATDDTDIPEFAVNAVIGVLTDLDDANNDIAQYAPNPFLNWSPRTNPSAGSPELTLVDGGEDLQNIPLTPLLSPLRAVDVIFAVDSSADTPNNFPNGTALRATYDRSLSPIANGTLFPAVPSARTFINLGLNQNPTFFGCDPAAFSLAPGESVPPLIVYVPNAPYSAWSNVSTFTSSYPTEERNAIIQNGYNVATVGNGTFNEQWPTCVACAVISRSLARTGTAVPAACQECFRMYCWDGRTDEEDRGEYSPELKLKGVAGSDSGAARGLGGGVRAWGAVVVGLVGFVLML